MTCDEDGIWSVKLAGDWAGFYYMYRITHDDQRIEVVVDPYARAVSPNGQRTAIIDLDTTHPPDWELDVKPVFSGRWTPSFMNCMCVIFPPIPMPTFRIKGNFWPSPLRD